VKQKGLNVSRRIDHAAGCGEARQRSSPPPSADLGDPQRHAVHGMRPDCRHRLAAESAGVADESGRSGLAYTTLRNLRRATAWRSARQRQA